jgi:2-dehydro-3-deoxygluconokinase
MDLLNIIAADDAELDLLALGEILLRFDPANERIQTARNFQVFDGGAEYNVSRNLSHVFRQRSGIATALVDNALGRLAENFARGSGMDVSDIVWRADDGKQRNGIYFIERGFGPRSPASCFDRGRSAASKLKSGDIDWHKIFEARGVRWFHTGGVFSGLSEPSAGLALEAMAAAKAGGAVISYDLNYRDSLWKNKGGRAAADAENRKLLPMADVVFGVLDFDARLEQFDEQTFRRSAESMLKDFPDLKIVASTLRNVRSASRHDLSAAAYAGGEVIRGPEYPGIEVLDRVGSGDAFASGVIYGLLGTQGIAYSLECGLANAVLTMTTAGDNSFVTLKEIEDLMAGGGRSIDR